MARRPFHRRTYAWILASLFITLTAVVPLAFVTFPHVYRWQMLSKVGSADFEQREASLRYVLTRAPHDKRVLRGAVVRLNKLANEPFFQLAGTLQTAGLWRRPTIPDEAWLRWLTPLMSDPRFENRILAAQRLADLGDISVDPRIVERLTKLLADENADVRLNALAAAAELAGAARYHKVDPAKLDELVVAATRDSEPRIARDAYIFVGLLDPASGVSANWNDAPAAVAPAIRWAAARTHSDVPTEPPAENEAQLPEPLETLRMLEGLKPDERLIAIPSDMPDMLRLTTVAVMKNPGPEDLRPLFASDEPSMRDLACIVAVDRFSKEQQEQLAGVLLRSFDDRDRMSGAILCGLTGVRPRATPLGVTGEPTGREVDLLPYRLRHENVWVVMQVMRLGLWMQGESVLDAEGQAIDMPRLASALLSTPDNVPVTTVLLAMLHARDPAALEYLLNPRGEQGVDLVQLFDQQRWWRVMRRYLPEDAPAFYWWTDPDQERFQVDVLRNWYLVHRVRIRTEWNSSSGSSTHGEAGQQ